MTHRSKFRCCVLFIAAVLTLLSATAQAAIPATERQALLKFYQATHGDSWKRSDRWNGAPGTECTWYGVTCNAGQTHVVAIYLFANNLHGYLPPSLPYLTRLVFFNVHGNPLYGPLPQLENFRVLRTFDVGGGGSGPAGHLSGSIPPLPSSIVTFIANQNELTGSIPPLAGLPNLKTFVVHGNDLSGPIPALQGLENLENFQAWSNELTGQIPPLAHLPNLEAFDVSTNSLSGPIPPLDDLPRLAGFGVRENELTGEIPPLQGLPSLSNFSVNGNLLTGNVPQLSGLHNLYQIWLQGNLLSGSIPPLTDLPSLGDIDLSHNMLSGTIPSLDEMPDLYIFDVSYNSLTGGIPSLAGFRRLTVFDVSNNQLTGPPPAVPSPNELVNGASALCPGYLDPVPSFEWDNATGTTPWYGDCVPPPPGVKMGLE